MGYIDLRKVKSGFWGKVDITKESLKALKYDIDLYNFSITKLAIEDPVKKFRRGMSSANTIALLAKFNIMVSYFARELFLIDPIYIDATAARKAIGIPLLSKKKAGGKNQKEQTFEYLSNSVFKHEVWELNRNKKVQPYCLDKVDAYVIAEACNLGLGDPA